MKDHGLSVCVADFYYACADALNYERFAQWPEFFADEGPCDYPIVSRENHELNLPAPIMGCYTHGMVKDRVAMLIKGALTYRHIHFRHFITNVRAQSLADGAVAASANLLVMQSDHEGNSSTYMVGRYEDELLPHGESFRFRKRLVIVDSFNIDTALAVPL